MNEHAKPIRTAKLFKNGRSQAVRLPAEFEFEGDEVEIRRDEVTGEVILKSKSSGSSGWDEFFRLRALIPPADLDGFLEDREQDGQIRDDPFE